MPTSWSDVFRSALVSALCCAGHCGGVWSACGQHDIHYTEWRMNKYTNFTFMWPCIVTCDRASWQILIIKPPRCINFSNLFWNENLHISNNSSVHHQELFTVHSAMVYVVQFCRQLSSRIRMEHSDPASKMSTNLYDIYHCCVYSEKILMKDRGIVRNM
jgi:hypothetical protein